MNSRLDLNEQRPRCVVNCVVNCKVICEVICKATGVAALPTADG